MDESNKEIAVLEKMNELAVNPPTDIEESKIKSPLEKVEGDIAKFSSDILDIYRKDVETSDKINEKIQAQLELDEKDGGFSNAQLIALRTNYSTTLNEQLNRTMGPMFQLMTAKQQNEYAAKQAEAKQQAAVQVNVGTGQSTESMKQLNESVTSDVLVGMSNLNSFLNAFKKLSEKTEEKSSEN